MNNLIMNLYEGPRHVDTLEHAAALLPLGSIYFREGADGGAYRVESVVYVDAKYGGFDLGWAVFLKRVPVEETPLGIYDPSYYTPDGVEL